MSQTKWFMLFLSQISILCLLSLLQWGGDLFPTIGWYQGTVLICYLFALLLLGRWMSILFFDEGTIGPGHRILMMLLLPGTILYFSLMWSSVIIPTTSPGLLVIHLVGWFFVSVFLLLIKKSFSRNAIK